MPHIEEEGFDGFGDGEGATTETKKMPKSRSMLALKEAEKASRMAGGGGGESYLFALPPNLLPMLPF